MYEYVKFYNNKNHRKQATSNILPDPKINVFYILSLLAAAHKLPEFLFPFPLCLQVLPGYIMNLQVLPDYIMSFQVLPGYIMHFQVLPGYIMNLEVSTLSRLFISLFTISVSGQ